MHEGIHCTKVQFSKIMAEAQLYCTIFFSICIVVVKAEEWHIITGCHGNDIHTGFADFCISIIL